MSEDIKNKESSDEDKENAVGKAIESAKGDPTPESKQEGNHIDESLNESKTESEVSKNESIDDSKHESDQENKEEEEEMDDSKEENLNESKNDTSLEDDSPKKGKSIHDQSLEIKGKRDRRKVERFVQEVKKEEVEVLGNGTPLGEIPYIEAMITKMVPEELKTMHRIAYGRNGTSLEIRRNLKKFSGFPFSKEDKLFERKKSCVERLVSSELKKILVILGLGKNGVKNELVERVLNFFLEPSDQGKSLPKSKRTSKGPSKKKSKNTKKGKQKKEPSAEESDSEDEAKSDSDDKSESDEKSESEVEEVVEVKKPQKKIAKTPVRKAPAKKSQKKRAKPEVSDDDSSSDDEPLVKKVKKAPTDAEIKAFIKKLLDMANLEEVTMKKLCQQVYDNYPGHDLSNKKDFIKTTVKSILS